MLRFASRSLVAGAVFVAVTSGGCSEGLEGPTPTLPKVAKKDGPLQPGIVCNDQHSTEVTVRGTALSPVPIDIPKDPKIALPTLTLSRGHDLDGASVKSPDVVVWSGDPDKDETNAFGGADGKTPLLTWKSQTEMTFTVQPELTLADEQEGKLPAGVYDVRVENATGGSAQSAGALAVVDKPALTDLSPSIVCLQEGAQAIELTGTGLLGLDGASPTLSVEGIAEPLPVTLPDCTAVAHDGIDAKLCTTGSIELPQGALGDAYAALTVTNPETAACHTEEDIKVRVVPKPVVDSVVEPLACIAQGDRTFVVSGAGFLVIDDLVPAVSIGGADVTVAVPDAADCMDLPTKNHTVSTCTRLTVTLADGALSAGLHTLVLQNPAPAGCSGTAEGAVRIVAPPTITDVVPPLACLDDGNVVVTVNGSDFLVIDGAEPAVAVEGVVLDAANVSPTGCVALADVPDQDMDGAPDKDAVVCDALELTLAMADAGLGTPDITVENPAPAGCDDTESSLLTIIEGPAITSVTPALVCTDDHSEPITIEGTGFVVIDDGGAPEELPAVTIGDAAVAVTGVDGCGAAQDANGLAFKQCTKVLATIAQGQLVSAGIDGRPVVTVTNPAPAGCASASSDHLVVPPALAINTLQEPSACEGSSGVQVVVAYGTGYLVLDRGLASEALPAVTVDAVTQPLTAADFAGCTTFTVPGFTTVESCTQVSLAIDVTGLTAGTTLPVAITNPAPASCAATASKDYEIVAPPSIANVAPANICSDVPVTLTITGTDFAAVATVLIGGEAASNVVVNGDGTQITADFVGLPAGSYDVTVRNAVGCEDTFGAQLTVHPTPLVLFVDPPIAYNRITIDATIFTANLSVGSPLDKVEIVDALENATPLCDMDGSAAPYPDCQNPKANRIIAKIPGLDLSSNPTFAAGDYTIRVTSALGCSGELSPFKVTATQDPTLVTAIDPSYVSSSEPTAVTITGSGFLAVPRVYLTPTSGAGTATPLRAVDARSATQLTAVIPPTAAGTYDLVVVNPDGKVGVLAPSPGVTVSDHPPFISSVVPGSLPAAGTITLSGSGFDKSGVRVELDCASGGLITGTSVSVTGPDANFGDTVTATVDVTSLPDGDVCIVRVINLADGSFFDYSAFSVTNSSLNLAPWTPQTGKDLDTARRALGLVAGRPTATSRYLYAIGGDDGVPGDPEVRGATVYDTVESISVDVFGTLGTAQTGWQYQRNSLPAPRTMAGSATIDKFVYLVGGHDGATATSTVYRARILDPLAGPEITDIDATLGDGVTTGLGQGLYYYAVAATFPGSDPSNPGGESAAGEVLPLQLPSNSRGIVLTFTWAAVTGASGYRIYRSPTPGATVDQMQLLRAQSCAAALCDCGTTATDCQYTDDDTVATTAGQTPTPSGSLGVWHEVATLGTARESHATVVVRDAVTPTKYFLYAIGGRDDAGGYLATYEFATITVAPDGSQSVSAWQLGSDTLVTARAELGAWVVDAQSSNLIRTDPDNAYSGTAADSWIFIGGGRTSGGGGNSVEAALVGASGDLGTIQDSQDFSGTHTGYGVGVANDQLYRFGPGSTGASAGFCKNGTCDVPPPDLQAGAWNALGSANTNRSYMGYTQESAFFFLVGGHDGTNTLATTERTVQ